MVVSLQLQQLINFSSILAVTLVSALILHRYVWTRVERWADTHRRWNKSLIRTFRAPLVVVLTLTSILVAGQVLPAQIRQEADVKMVVKLIFILTIMWTFNRVITAWQLVNPHHPESNLGAARQIVVSAIRVVIFSMGLLTALDAVGISITPVLASIGVGSVAAGLALQETLGNFFNGLYLVMDRPIRPGDFISIDDGIEGYVDRIGWRTTQIRLLANNMVILPNAKVANARIINFDYPQKELAILVEAGVAIQSDLDLVERVTLDEAKKTLSSTPGGVREFEPFMRYHTIGESRINFTIILRGRQFVDQYLIKHQFLKNLHRRYRVEGIDLGFPQRDVRVRSEPAERLAYTPRPNELDV